MKEAFSTLIILLVVAWVVQYGFSFLQLRRFYKRIYELRQFGSVWVGMHGSAWRGRVYAVLVVDKNRKIARVEDFSGWTIWATLKPVAGLEGRPVSDLMDDSIELPLKPRQLLALRNAVKYIQIAEQKAAENAELQSEVEIQTA